MRDEVEVEGRYPALSIIVWTLKVFAVLVAIAGCIGAVMAYNSGNGAAAAGIGVGTVVGVIGIWATAESIAVLMDIEANTRATVIATQRAAVSSSGLLREPVIPGHDKHQH